MTGRSTPNGTGASTPKPTVLVPEKLSPDGLALLRKHFVVDERSGLCAEDLAAIIPTYSALIIRSETKVTAALLAVAKSLKVVARAGVGVDNVDVEAATRLGIIVVNSPAGNIGAAAEHTIALLLATARNVVQGGLTLKDGKWERSKLVGVEIKGKTLAIIGLGKVGLNVARMANGLGMKVEALDPYASPAIAQAAHVEMKGSLAELLESADFLTIHTPLIASTKGMIGAQELASMKKGARVLNVARGGMIDEVALLEALDRGHIAGAGMDVFTSEPPTKDSSAMRLIAHPRCVATPHLGASTVEAQENVSIDVCEQVIAILSGDLPRSAVNAPLILPEEYKTLQPFVRLVEKMGSLYTQHYASPQRQLSGKATAEPRTTFDLVYEGGLATLTNTKPLFAALIKGLTASISATTVNIVNADIVAKERGISINEQHSRSPTDHTFSSLVTLRARAPVPSRASSSRRAGQNRPLSTLSSTLEGDDPRQIISGYVSGSQIFISRLGRFETSFVPEGNLLICHNYDSPGKIGIVGGILGKEGVNINYMTVAPLSITEDTTPEERGKEALMILGIDREISKEVTQQIAVQEGILDITSVDL